MSFFYEILNDGTAYRRKELRVKRLILTIAAALFVLITLLCSFAIIPSGYTGVRTTFGQIDAVAVANGFTAKIPYVQSIKRVNNKQQEVSYAEQIWGESSERTVVYAAGVTVTYRSIRTTRHGSMQMCPTTSKTLCRQRCFHRQSRRQWCHCHPTR